MLLNLKLIPPGRYCLVADAINEDTHKGEPYNGIHGNRLAKMTCCEAEQIVLDEHCATQT